MEARNGGDPKKHQQAMNGLRPNFAELSALWNSLPERKENQDVGRTKKIKKLKNNDEGLIGEQFYKSLYSCPNGSGMCRGNFCCCSCTGKKVIRRDRKHFSNLKQQCQGGSKPPIDMFRSNPLRQPYSYEIAIPKVIRPAKGQQPFN